jgi:hypothetical protein
VKRWLGTALQLALVALVAWLLWRRLSPELSRLRPADFARWRPSVPLLVASTAGLTLLHLFQAYLWRRVVIDVGAPAPDARTTIRVYFVAGLARWIPGNLWQFAGLAALGRQSGIPALASSAAGVIGNLAFLGTGVVFLAFTLPGAEGALQLLVAVLLAAAVVAAAFVFTATRAGARFREWLGARTPARLAPALELAGRIRPSHALAWTIGYGLSWLLLATSFAVFVEAFVPGSIGQARQLGGIMAASYLGGFLVLAAPAGIGVREGIMLGLLTGPIPASAALLVSVAQRVWFLVAEALALGSFVLLPRHPERNPVDTGGVDGGGKGRRHGLKEVL